ncbi:MAG: DnaA/Hda family protein, partial [Planctomycetota bacterium]
RHRGVDLLLLDDVQMLLGKRKTLEELQYTLDALVGSGAQVVFASDRAPTELTTLGGELASRLSAGVSVEVRPPDAAMRRELLARLTEERGVRLDEAAVDAVATGMIGGARELSGVVNRLRYETALFGDVVDETLARRAVAEVNRQSMPRVKLPDVQDAVCRVFGVDAALLKSGKRTRAASEPRMLAMWLARKYTRSAWSEIGAFFGNRRHSTVISACRRVEKLLTGSANIHLDGADCAIQEALRRVEAVLRAA